MYRPDYDIFCTVVDNYGDIGVCWRLARQLAHERGRLVRLWVDDLASFQRLCPTVDSQAAEQQIQGVRICHWSESLPPDVVAGVTVIEAFACNLPPSFLAAMDRAVPPPRWFNLEYLSAEPWVDGCHGLPSPGRPNLLKVFFFPGFTPRTGGLIREQGLKAERESFQADGAAQAAYWQQLGVAPPRPDELRISLFSYANPAMAALFEAWQTGTRAITVLLPQATAAAQWVKAALPALRGAGEVYGRGALRVHVIPFTEQPAYDRLLWACDLNFVRGEDSFVRAQWAGRPLVWHIYPQEEQAHMVKLQAFLKRYLQDWDGPSAQAMADLNLAWNGGPGPAVQSAWRALEAALPNIRTGARQWAEAVCLQTDLVSNLEKFAPHQL